jgi:hypothetical protein
MTWFMFCRITLRCRGTTQLVSCDLTNLGPRGFRDHDISRGYSWIAILHFHAGLSKKREMAQPKRGDIFANSVAVLR